MVDWNRVIPRTHTARMFRRPDQLSEAQEEALRLLAEGYSNPAIASQLGIPENGVIDRLERVYQKLGIANTGIYSQRVVAAMIYLGIRVTVEL